MSKRKNNKMVSDSKQLHNWVTLTQNLKQRKGEKRKGHSAKAHSVPRSHMAYGVSDKLKVIDEK